MDLVQQRSLLPLELVQQTREALIGIVILLWHVTEFGVEGHAVALLEPKLVELFLEVFVVNLLLVFELEFGDHLVGLQGFLGSEVLVQNFLKFGVLAGHFLNDFLRLGNHFFIGTGLLLFNALPDS